jgi:hypothetical protein
MRVAVAGFTGKPPEFRDDELLVELLGARGLDAASPSWDDRSVDWDSFDLVVARSPWDYTWRLDEFLAWADSIGERLENPPEVIRWNSDKHYLADLSDAGLPVVETTYVGPGERPPAIEREVVVKPAVSGGARDTGRFGPGSAAEAVGLIERITGRGDVAMVQPYVASVEAQGETAVIVIAGEVSHVLRKHALLAADEVAPVRADDALGVAEVMYDPGLVVAGSAEPDELELAGRMLEAVRDRFAKTPLIARVDMLRDADGEPVLLELEAIEPNLYFEQSPGAAERLADAIAARARRGA